MHSHFQFTMKKFMLIPGKTGILGLQPIPGDPKRQWHGGHVG